MKALQRMREARRRAALVSTGIDPRRPSHFAAQAEAALQGTDLTAAPTVRSNIFPPVTSGSPRPFVMDLDPMDGPNPLM